MKLAKLTLSGILCLLPACGGGSSGPSSNIEGIWRGDRFEGGLTCADGMFIGAGSGSVTGTTNLDVVGSDEIGSAVSASDGECKFQGVRTANGFTADAVSGCYVALVSINFRLDVDNKAVVGYRYDINKVQVTPGQIACVPGEYANVVR